MQRNTSRAVILTALLLACAGCTSTNSEAGVLRGRVVGLADGDTITVLDADHDRERIRLVGIDAPEKRQPFGKRSKQHLAELVFHKEVEVRWSKRDRYGRILGKVLVADPACSTPSCPKVDASLEQVSAGLAWWYRHYANEQSPADRVRFRRAEETSRARRLGLWVDPEPVPPWDWRHSGRQHRGRAASRRAGVGGSR